MIRLSLGRPSRARSALASPAPRPVAVRGSLTAGLMCGPRFAQKNIVDFPSRNRTLPSVAGILHTLCLCHEAMLRGACLRRPEAAGVRAR